MDKTVLKTLELIEYCHENNIKNRDGIIKVIEKNSSTMVEAIELGMCYEMILMNEEQSKIPIKQDTFRDVS